MATSSTLTAAGTSNTADNTAACTASTAACQEPIVVQLGQATPSVTLGARPEVIYGSQPHFSGQQYTAASRFTAAQPFTAGPQPYFTAAQQYIAPYNINTVPAMSARPAEPIGYFGQAGQFPLMLTQEQLLHQQQLLREKQEFDAWRASRAQAKTSVSNIS